MTTYGRLEVAMYEALVVAALGSEGDDPGPLYDLPAETRNAAVDTAVETAWAFVEDLWQKCNQLQADLSLCRETRDALAGMYTPGTMGRPPWEQT